MEKYFKIMLEGTTLQIDLDDELSAANSPSLLEALARYKGQDIQEIVFDATDLAFISSSGIRVIIYCSRELGKQPRIVFVNCAKEIYESFEITGLHDFIIFKDDKLKESEPDPFDPSSEWKQKMAKTKQKMLESYAANNDVVSHQMKLGQEE